MSLFEKNCPTCTFNDGNYTTNIVGKKEYFKDEKDFLDYCKEGYGEDYYQKLDDATVDKVYLSHVRWFPNGVEGMDERRGVYSFGKSGRGATEVYVLDIY